ncbi:MAG TPA: FtsQ-type POTRA domain-containing protein [Propionibacteriaceae bacterium]|jgi:cell division protein FtsQ|nr:FtsQ-type POTRA domain-containing protein [Propionibacteriaceae bacterium]
MTATATATRRARPASTNKNRKKRKKKSRRSWRRKALALIVIAVIVALVAAGLWVVYYSSALVTKRVNVVGSRNLTPVQVSLTAQVPVGVPLARQDLDAIAERLTAVPSIETAAVSRSWPNTITLTIVERRPVLAVLQPDGYVVVDKYGVAYQTQPTLPPKVVLADVDTQSKPLLSAVAVVATALPEKLNGKVKLITASSPDSIALILGSGRIITWGSSADSELKAKVVTALLKRKPKSSIDVSSPHNPAVR